MHIRTAAHPPLYVLGDAGGRVDVISFLRASLRRFIQIFHVRLLYVEVCRDSRSFPRHEVRWHIDQPGCASKSPSGTWYKHLEIQQMLPPLIYQIAVVTVVFQMITYIYWSIKYS